MTEVGAATEPDEVERIAPPTREEFVDRYVRRRRPVVIRGALEEWPARRWTPAGLVERFGDSPVPVAAVEGRRVVNDPAEGIPYREEALRDLIARLDSAAAPDGYAMVILADHLQGLARDLEVPEFAPPAPWAMYKLWLSAADTRSPLHMDLPDNLFCQFFGRKRVKLFPPAQELRMYRHPPWSRLPQVSRVDAEAPDLQRYPRFAGAAPLGCTVEPGDVLYIPRFWWHQVRSIDLSISVNYWWATGWVWGVVRTALAYQKLRSLRF